MNLRDSTTMPSRLPRTSGWTALRMSELAVYFNGTVTSEAEKNAIWDAIKTVPDWAMRSWPMSKWRRSPARARR